MLMKIRAMLKKKDNQKGFTIIELIIVMAILAVLAAVAIPRYQGILADSRTKADTANQAMIKSAAELYVANTGTEVTAIGNIIPTYLAANPDDPTTTDVTTGGYAVTTTAGVATVTKIGE